jgi:hypothetical protein
MSLRRLVSRSLLVLALGGAVVLGAPRVAVADSHEDDDFTRPGAFAGLGFKWQVQGFQDEFRDLDYGNSWGFDARGGYRFFDWFAVEGIFEYADDFGANAPRANTSRSSRPRATRSSSSRSTASSRTCRSASASSTSTTAAASPTRSRTRTGASPDASAAALTST